MKKILISNLTSKINNKTILKNISLQAHTGDVVAILGPNGAGKSTILKSIFNHYSINHKTGKILFNNKNITHLDTTAIAKLGFFYCMQNPIELSGVKNLDLLKLIANNESHDNFSATYKVISNGIKQLNLPNEILTRDVNVNFSGGQKKKNEILQSILFNPSVLLLDEIDSGLDVDAMKVIAQYINSQKSKSIILIVSHHLEFLKFIKPTKVIVLINGQKIKEGKQEIIKLIENKGFDQFIAKNKKTDNFSKDDPFVCATRI
jgi:Fe-S cluster assembly ATP-binding protein